MQSLKEFKDITQQIIHQLEVCFLEDREKAIEEVEVLLQKRSELLPKIQSPKTEAERELGCEVLLLEKNMQNLMEEKKQLIKKDIQNLKKQKKSSESYLNPYQSLLVDGIYYDKKN